MLVAHSGDPCLTDDEPTVSVWNMLEHVLEVIHLVIGDVGWLLCGNLAPHSFPILTISVIRYFSVRAT